MLLPVGVQARDFNISYEDIQNLINQGKHLEDPEQEFEYIIAHYERSKGYLPDYKDTGSEEYIRKRIRKNFVDETVRLLEYLTSHHNYEKAKSIQQRALRIVDDSRIVASVPPGKPPRVSSSLQVKTKVPSINDNIVASEYSGRNETCKPKALGSEFSRANPIPGGGPGRWYSVCDQTFEENGKTIPHPEIVSAWHDDMGIGGKWNEELCEGMGGTFMYELGGCPGGVQETITTTSGIFAWPKSMSRAEAGFARYWWFSCGINMEAAAESAKRLCEIKTGCPCITGLD